ncbi:MAG TPA: hypothetical protein VMY77_09200 [Chitinophagaceae bacterium]|nr:hypothetical protein [Chitinophagaceae bacterium]
MKAILGALSKAERYKQWLRDLPHDSNLIAEYCEKVEEKTILEKLPFKAIRFYIFNALGEIINNLNPALGIPMGVVLNGFDTFLVGNLVKQWKPNQFVENDLKPLLNAKEI